MTNRRREVNRAYMVLEMGASQLERYKCALAVIFPSSDHTSVVPIVRHLPHSAMRMLIRNHRFIMPVARGTFQINFGTFKGVFIADGYEVIVEGRFPETHISVNVPHAEFDFADLTSIIGPFTVTCPPSYVGIDTIYVELVNPHGEKLIVTGTIQGGLDQRYLVSGSGTLSRRKKGEE